MNTIRKSIREGGPIEQWKTRRGREEMKKAATELPQLDPPPEGSEGSLKVHFLTGEDFWYQTLFCFVSLQEHCEVRVTPVVYGDGTLDTDAQQQISRVIPWAQFEVRDDIEDRLDTHLPRSQYPTLRERRIEYVHLRKLTDFYAGTSGWKLVLDSDMLFFDTPDLLVDWLRNPGNPLHMRDAVESYGYSRDLMKRLVGNPIPERVNVGIVGLRNELIDWDALEYWCREMNEQELASYLQEQALTAMLLAGRERTVAPRPAYLTLPSVDEGRNPTATLHHYVAESKRAYFQHGWRHIIRAI